MKDAKQFTKDKAGLLANQLLQKRLAPFGYYTTRHTPGL
jgi:hypothetical protein